MKNAIVLFAVVFISASVFAQATNTQKTSTQTTQVQTKTTPTTAKDFVLMKGGKVYSFKEGKMTEVKADFTIGGTKVAPDGKVTMKDGTTASLKEGDRVLDNGTLKKAAVTTQTKEAPKQAPEKKTEGTK